MIEKTIAIPLSIYPYSSTSRLVHWLTRHHGKISTILKGALRPKSPFLGEYELFSTSELLYFNNLSGGLYPGKECALITTRDAFRTNWRAALSASYLTALITRTTPDEAPLPGLFELYEELLDVAADVGHHPAFTIWAELQLCDYHGHAPNLKNCLYCAAEKELRFSAASGGTICPDCARINRIATIESPADSLTILRYWQQSSSPKTATATKLSLSQQKNLNTIMEQFIAHHLHVTPAIRQTVFKLRKSS